MALNPEFVGKQYPDTAPYLIGREKVREFATAIGEQSPVFHDLAEAVRMGYSDLPAPPTFAFVLTHKAMAAAMFDPDLGLDYSRVVHGEQAFEYRRPLVAGDEVVVTATSTLGDPNIAIIGPGETPGPTTFNVDDADLGFLGLDAQGTFTATTAGVHRIIVGDSFGQGTYQLTVERA